MMMKTNKSFVRAGNRRRINLDYVRDVSWEFDNDGGDIKVTFIFSDGVYLDLFLDEEEFCEFLGGLNHAEI